GKLAGGLRKFGEAHDVAHQDAKDLLAAEPRELERIGNVRSDLSIQLCRDFLRGACAVERARLRQLFDPLRGVENLLSQKRAVREDSDQILKSSVRMHDPQKGRRLSLFKAGERRPNARWIR